RTLVVGSVAVAACSGHGRSQVPPPGGTRDGAAGASTAGASGTEADAADRMGAGGTSGDAGMPSSACLQPQAAPVYAALLSPSQYDHTVLDLFKLDGDPAKDFGGGSATQLDELGVERRANAAADLAHQAAISLAAWAPCQVPPADAAACEQQIIDGVGPRAYRHPLAAAERAELQTLFDAGVKESGFATGVEWFLTGLFQSPDFLYQLVRPAAGEQPGQVRPLGGYEGASRPAYFLWDSTPDDQLAAAAAARAPGDAPRGGAAPPRPPARPPH